MFKKRGLILFLMVLLFVLTSKIALSTCNYNGVCERYGDYDENEGNCPQDCLTELYCGDGTCDSGNNEDCSSCSIDCGSCIGGSCSNDGDCAGDLFCGCDNTCVETTPECCTDSDCGQYQRCSSGVCEYYCGNGQCESTETCEVDSCCGGVEVDFSSDPDNCGGCGVLDSAHICDTGEICDSGSCTTECPSDQCTLGDIQCSGDGYKTCVQGGGL